MPLRVTHRGNTLEFPTIGKTPEQVRELAEKLADNYARNFANDDPPVFEFVPDPSALPGDQPASEPITVKGL